MSELVAIICALVWLYLIGGRGAFWICRVRDTGHASPDLQQWPAVVAVVPARNEADHIAASVGSLLRQEYPGSFSIVLVDDDSRDGTASVATRAAASVPSRQLIVVGSKSLRAVGPGRSGPSSRASPPLKNYSPNISFLPTPIFCTHLTRLLGS